MRYLVKARVKPDREKALLHAIEEGTLGEGSVAGDEYIENMEHARLAADGTAHWVETCFCANPLEEERPFWEEYFDLISIKEAHSRRDCRDLNRSEPWACCHCQCTLRLEKRLQRVGKSFFLWLRDQPGPEK